MNNITVLYIRVIL